jgi:hypothetical protein
MHAKRWVAVVLVGLGALVLGGCPIYSESRDHRVCLQSGQCYSCPNDYYSSDCYAYGCNGDYDCPTGYSCNYGSCNGSGAYPLPDGGSAPTCSRPTDCPSGQVCGADAQCHVGDCSNWGCTSGYQCKLSNGSLQCVGGGAPDGGNGDGGSTFNGCHNDAECASTPGAKCLNGACVAPQDQCFDTTQCPANEQCVAGVCTPGCASGSTCPTGFSCDPKTSVCSGNPTPCGTTADGGTCSGSNVCVEDHCVLPCGVASTCPSGQVCVAGGCIPDQKPQFTCAKEGTQDACAAGSICIHHSCYIGCNADAGADACKNADKFNVCKSVTTSGGTYSVCGSSSNLGTQCDPTTGKQCPNAGAVCIDGFCN